VWASIQAHGDEMTAWRGQTSSLQLVSCIASPWWIRFVRTTHTGTADSIRWLSSFNPGCRHGRHDTQRRGGFHAHARMRERALGEAGASCLSLSRATSPIVGQLAADLGMHLQYCMPCMATNRQELQFEVLPHHPVTQYITTQQPATGQRDPNAMSSRRVGFM
jgi:hypothetical protein